MDEGTPEMMARDPDTSVLAGDFAANACCGESPRAHHNSILGYYATPCPNYCADSYRKCVKMLSFM